MQFTHLTNEEFERYVGLLPQLTPLEHDFLRRFSELLETEAELIAEIEEIEGAEG